MSIIGIMGAMHEEIQGVIRLVNNPTQREIAGRSYTTGSLKGHQVVICISRIGKVASAITATTMLRDFNCDFILFTGVAGAAHPAMQIGDIVIGHELFQHDMDASPIFEKHTIPLINKKSFQTCHSRSEILLACAREFAENIQESMDPKVLDEFAIKKPQVYAGDIASGDQFISCPQQRSQVTTELPTIKCLEMEGAAVAQVCHEHGAPFTIVRTISDAADGHAPSNFSRFIQEIAGQYSIHLILGFLTQWSPSTET